MVVLFWTKTEDQVDYYQVRYKSKSGLEKWKFAETDADQNQITITGLMADTVYVFQVRGVFQDQEGSYGPANDAVKTAESLATYLLKFSINVAIGNPPKYQLLAQELKPSRNRSAKTRKLILGNLKGTCYFLFPILRNAQYLKNYFNLHELRKNVFKNSLIT